MFAAIAALMCSCTKEEESESANNTSIVENDSNLMTIKFSPYEITPMKTTNPISEVTKRLDVYIVDLSTSDTMCFHQLKTNNNYGSITTPLKTNKMYHLYAVAHNVISDTATFSNDIISFSNDSVKQTLFIDTVFTPANGLTLNLEMYRIVGMFKLVMTDPVVDVPSGFSKMNFSINTATGNRWNINGYSVNRINQVRTINSVNRGNDGNITLNVYIMSHTMDSITTVNIEANAMNSSNTILETRTFNNVPIKNGYITKYTGGFFVTFDMQMSFTTGDWGELGNYNY